MVRSRLGLELRAGCFEKDLVEVWSIRGSSGVRSRQLRGLTRPRSHPADANAFNSRARAATSCARPRRELWLHLNPTAKFTPKP